MPYDIGPPSSGRLRSVGLSTETLSLYIYTIVFLIVIGIFDYKCDYNNELKQKSGKNAVTI